jgi:tetratricopeptide (TPR) repeat protein
MTGPHRKLGLWLAAALLTAPVALAQDVQSTFKEGLELLERGRKEEALRAFQKVLAMDPTNEQAYELWTSTDQKLWLEILTERGDMELVGRRLMGLVESARRERRNDEESIRKLLGELSVDDPISRTAAIRQLAADHGEYATPHLLGWLGDSGNEERRITAIQALTQMNVDVVLPLIEVLDTEDTFLRQNVVMVLKRIKDPRAAGAMARIAAGDADGVCRNLAQEALVGMGAAGANAASSWTSLGNDYHMRRATVLSDYHWSDVVWNFVDGRLAPTPTPRALYADALAKKCFHRALLADPAHVPAHAGLARAHAGEIAAVDALRRSGADVAEWEGVAANAGVAIGLGGAVAADAALAASVAENDSGAAVVLVRSLSEMASAPTAAMARAMTSTDGATQNEAVVALGNMSIWGKSRANAELIRALGAIASREVLRTAFVIDGDAARAKATADALRGAGLLVNSSASGVQGLAMLRRMAGVDLVVVADRLSDVTTHQVLTELDSEAHLTAAPVFIATSSPDDLAEVFGDKAAGAFDAADLSAVTAAMEGNLGAERERADALAQAAATILAQLSGTGTDVSSVAGELAGALNRTDGVSVPAAYALVAAGNASHVAALSAVVGDAARSEAVRIAAAHALTAMFGRGVAAGDAGAILHAVAHSDAPVSVRKAAAQALGASSMPVADRVGHLGALGKPAQN